MIQPHTIKIIPSADHAYRDGEMIGKPAQIKLSILSTANNAADKLLSAVGVMNTDNPPSIFLYFFDALLKTEEVSDTRPFSLGYEDMTHCLGSVLLWDVPEMVGVGSVSTSETYDLNQPLYVTGGPAAGSFVYVYAVYMTNNVDSDAQPAPMNITLCVEYEVKL